MGSFGALVVMLTVAAAAAAAEEAAGPIAHRDARFFLGRRTVTRIVLERSTVVERTAPSCVALEPSLPPCRGLRALVPAPAPGPAPALAPARPDTILATEAAQLPLPVASDAAPRTALQDDEAESRTIGRTVTGGRRPWAPAPPVASEYGAVAPTPALPSQQLTLVTPDDSRWNWNLFGGSDVVVTEVVKQLETRKVADPDLMITFSVTGCRPSRLPFDLESCDAVPHVEVSKKPDPREQA